MSSVFSLMLCACAVVAAALFPARERGMAVVTAVAMLPNWLLCGWTFSAWSPYALLGIPGSDIWAIADALFGGIVILVAYNRWWGRALWIVALIQEIVHFLYFGDMLAPAAYLSGLDGLFLIQVAIFVAGGGKGAGDLLHSGVVRLRRPRRSSTPALARQATGFSWTRR